jgi:hypothetical protein
MKRALAALLILSCGGDDEDVEGTGQACETADDCYADLEEEVEGTVQCLSVSGGYCTHTCTVDADCCAIDGECDYGDRGELVQICAPFTSQQDRWCFLSCEDSALARVPEEDRATFCEDISSDLGCRATGGGDPKKVCLPSGG